MKLLRLLTLTILAIFITSTAYAVIGPIPVNKSNDCGGTCVLPNGNVYANVTLEANTCPGGTSGVLITFAANTTLLLPPITCTTETGNFGIQSAGFNYSGEDELDVTLPAGWGLVNNTRLDGLGVYTVKGADSGQFRTDPLQIAICGSSDLFEE